MPNVYLSKYYDPKEKTIKPQGHFYSVDFSVQDSWYDEVRITRIPATRTMDALTKAGKMLERVLPGATPIEVSYSEDK